MKIAPIMISLMLAAGAFVGITTYYGGIQNVYSPGGNATATTFIGFNETIMYGLNRSMTDLEQHTAGFVNKDITNIEKYYDAALIFVDVLKVFAQMAGLGTSFSNMVMEGMVIFPMWFKTMVGFTVIIIIITAVAAIATKRDEV